MIKKTLTGIAFAAIAITAVQAEAQAGDKVHFGLYLGGPYYDGPYISFTDGDYRPYRKCSWMKRKARRTGRRYWWKRYRRCKSRYYDW